MAVDSKRVKSIFTAAAELSDQGARRQLLDRECGSDLELRQRVDLLLSAFDAPKPALDRPLAHLAVDPAPTGTLGSGADEPKQNDGRSTNAVGATIAGKYKLLQLIGEGGMGSVYLAEQLHPVKRKVAVKLIKDAGESRLVLSRFEAERQALALMDHPNIAKVLDAGTTGDPNSESPRNPRVSTAQGTPFFVMELVKGVPITQYCDDARLRVTARLELFRHVCHAVNHAHQKGVIHRDLKPTNILVEEHDGKPVAKVIDFGLAKAMGELTLTDQTLFTALGVVAGTPLYMAPEQARFNAIDIDTRADVYALGVVLYELLTGTTPIARETLKRIALDEVLRVIREKEPQSPSHRISSSDALPNLAATRQTEPAKLGRFVRGELDWIAMKALAKERDRRYDSAMDLAHDIERFLNHEPVQAGPPSKVYRFRKFVRRNRTGVVAASLVLLALVGGVVGTTIGMVRANQARLAELEQRQAAEEQRKAADAQRLIAESQRATAVAVNDFLQKDLLEQGALRTQDRGGEARDPDIKVRTLLDRAATKIDGKFASLPVTEAAIRLTIGETYRHMSLFQRARPHLERAVQLYEKHLGPTHPDTIIAVHMLALVRYEQGEWDAAAPLLERVLREFANTLGADHRETITAKSSLAKLYFTQAKYGPAESMHLEILDSRRRLFGDDDPDTLTTKLNLALLYKETGKFDLAEKFYRDVIKSGTIKLGSDHPTVVGAQNYLGMLLRSQGKFDSAIAIFSKLLDPQTSKLPEDDMDALTARINLASTYLPQGRPQEAEPLLERALQIGVPKLGNDHSSMLLAKSYLATAYRMTRKFDKSEVLFRELIAARTAKFGADHPATLADKNSYAQLLSSVGNLAAAEKILLEVLAVETSKYGAEHRNTITTRTNLGLVYLAMKDGPKAEPLLRSALQGRIATLGQGHPTTLTAKSNLAEALIAQKKYTEAAPLLVEEYDGLDKLGVAIPAAVRRERQVGDLDRLIRLAELTNRPEEAKKWQTAKVGLMLTKPSSPQAKTK